MRDRALLWTLPFWVISFAYGAAQISLTSSGETSGYASIAGQVSLFQRIWVADKTVYLYLRMLVAPNNLTALHGFGPRSLLWLTVVELLAGAGMAVLGTIWLLRRRPEGFGLLWCFVAMGPVANLIGMNTGRPLAEQRMYLPSAGLCLLLGALVVRSSNALRPRNNVALVSLAAMLVVPLMIFSIHLTDVWSDRLSLWRHGVRHSPATPAPHNQLANQYRDRGYQELRLAEMAVAKEHGRGQAKILASFASATRLQGNRVEAAAFFREAVNAAAWYVPAHEGLALTLWELRQYAEAEKACLTGLRVAPRSAVLHNVLGNLFAERGDFKRACSEFKSAVDAKPEFLDAGCNLAMALAFDGRAEEAERELERIREIDPSFRGAQAAAAKVYQITNQHRKAIAIYEKLLKDEKKDSPRELVDLYRELATSCQAIGDREGTAEALRELRAVEDSLRAAQSTEGSSGVD